MLERRARDADRLCGDSQTAIVERLHGVHEPLSLVAEQIFRGDAHIVEIELDRRRRAQPELVFLFADIETGKIRSDDEGPDAKADRASAVTSSGAKVAAGDQAASEKDQKQDREEDQLSRTGIR